MSSILRDQETGRLHPKVRRRLIWLWVILSVALGLLLLAWVYQVPLRVYHSSVLNERRSPDLTVVLETWGEVPPRTVNLNGRLGTVSEEGDRITFDNVGTGEFRLNYQALERAHRANIIIHERGGYVIILHGRVVGDVDGHVEVVWSRGGGQDAIERRQKAAQARFDGTEDEAQVEGQNE